MSDEMSRASHGKCSPLGQSSNIILVTTTASLVLALFVVMWVGAWMFDEGVISIHLDHFKKTGDLRYLFQNMNARHAFGAGYYLLLDLCQPKPLAADYYALSRIPSFVLSVVSLFCVLGWVSRCIANNVIRVLALCVFVSLAFELQAYSARYDSPYMFGVAVALYATTRADHGRWQWLLVAAVSNAFAVTAHSNGVGGLLFCIVIWVYYRHLYRGVTAWMTMAGGVVVGTATAWFLLAGRTPQEFMRDLSYLYDAAHVFSVATPFLELDRYRDVPAMLPLTALALFLPIEKTAPRCVRCARMSLALLVVFLALQPAKWPMYLGLTLPIVVCVGSYHLQRYLRVGRLVAHRRGISGKRLPIRIGGLRVDNALLVVCIVVVCISTSLHVRRDALDNTLFQCWVNPGGETAVQVAKLRSSLAGKTVNLYSDPRVVPLLGDLDFSLHYQRQPDPWREPPKPLGQSGECLFYAPSSAWFTLGVLIPHPQIGRYPPKRVAQVDLFGELWSVYTIRQD